MSRQYRICSRCGCALDPGEICECKNKPITAPEKTVVKEVNKEQNEYIPQEMIDTYLKKMRAVKNTGRYIQLEDPELFFDPDEKQYKPAYSTYVKFGPLGWLFLGKCFLGELFKRSP